MSSYIVIDNAGSEHALKASNDAEALRIMHDQYTRYIYSILSSDSIVIIRPNGYILAYIDTATGYQNVKKMSDWMK